MENKPNFKSEEMNLNHYPINNYNNLHLTPKLKNKPNLSPYPDSFMNLWGSNPFFNDKLLQLSVEFSKANCFSDVVRGDCFRIVEVSDGSCDFTNFVVRSCA